MQTLDELRADEADFLAGLQMDIPEDEKQWYTDALAEVRERISAMLKSEAPPPTPQPPHEGKVRPIRPRFLNGDLPELLPGTPFSPANTVWTFEPAADLPEQANPNEAQGTPVSEDIPQPDPTPDTEVKTVATPVATRSYSDLGADKVRELDAQTHLAAYRRLVADLKANERHATNGNGAPDTIADRISELQLAIGYQEQCLANLGYRVTQKARAYILVPVEVEESAQ